MHASHTLNSITLQTLKPVIESQERYLGCIDVLPSETPMPAKSLSVISFGPKP